MAREANITQEQVNAVADQLRGAGIKPTVRAVRDKLGTGSNATVMKLLESWKATQVKVAEVPVTLPVSLQRALVDYLAQAVAEQKAELGAELAEQKQVNADLAVENERQADDIEAVRAELEAMRTERDSLLGRMVQQEADLRLVRGEVEQERAAAESVRTELAKAQLRLEALPRLESDLATARDELARERKGRASDNEREREARATAEQQAAVALARLEAAEAGRKRAEEDYIATVQHERAAAEQVRDLTARLAAERLAHVKTERDLKAATEQLQASRRARLAGVTRKPLNEQPAGDGKAKK